MNQQLKLYVGKHCLGLWEGSHEEIDVVLQGFAYDPWEPLADGSGHKAQLKGQTTITLVIKALDREPKRRSPRNPVL